MMTKCFVKQCFVVIARNVFGLPNTDLISRLVRGYPLIPQENEEGGKKYRKQNETVRLHV